MSDITALVLAAAWSLAVYTYFQRVLNKLTRMDTKLMQLSHQVSMLEGRLVAGAPAGRRPMAAVQPPWVEAQAPTVIPAGPARVFNPTSKADNEAVNEAWRESFKVVAPLPKFPIASETQVPTDAKIDPKWQAAFDKHVLEVIGRGLTQVHPPSYLQDTGECLIKDNVVVNEGPADALFNYPPSGKEGAD